jgi:iron(III) transport system ATP-binding protein
MDTASSQGALVIAGLGCDHPGPSASPQKVICDFDLQLSAGEIGCLLGASGCGKTTVLRTIAGFHAPSAGHIWLDNRLLCSADAHVAPEKRRVGMVFQDYALFPHLTVKDNICFGIHRLDKRTQATLLEDLLALVKLEGLHNRYPNELSGGQQQRVALARALAPSPALLLLDEPLSNLDTELRRGLALELREILKARAISALMVTHDQHEAFAFADRLGIVHQGRIEQWDSPYNIYHEPNSRYVARFVGQGVFLPGIARSTNSIECELGLLVSQKNHRCAPNQTVDVLLRPDDIVEDSHSPYQATVITKLFAGTATLYTLALASGRQVACALPSHHNFDVGSQLGIRVAADHLIAFMSA